MAIIAGSTAGQSDNSQRLFVEVGRTPQAVFAAMQFVAMCNNYMRAQTLEYENGEPQCEIVELDLPTEQEQAFRLACSCIGRYFSAAAKSYQEGK